MFGQEVPLYDKSLAVNLRCNRAVADLLQSAYDGLELSDESILGTSRERHGAIRIGRPDEFRWIVRFFACFGMEPHNYYDMTDIGAKSQPVTATAFRSQVDPHNRIFASLLRTDYFEESTARRIESLLSSRQVFSDAAMELVDRHERQGGLSNDDAQRLIDEGTKRIFKWTGEARGRDLYEELCAEGFKIAADIACFGSHHLNHLTPNTLCIDLYSDAMKWRLGIIDLAEFETRTASTLDFLDRTVDADWLMLHFRHLEHDEVHAFSRTGVAADRRNEIMCALVETLEIPELDLSALEHNGYKDATEGPAPGTQVLLRQDAYRALTEPIRFMDETPPFESEHTARFGEIEQRFYAATPKGRRLYDACLQTHTDAAASGSVPGRDVPDGGGDEWEEPTAFSAFPATLDGMLAEGLVHATFDPAPGVEREAAACGSSDFTELLERGLIRRRGMRYEDFLPISAAGIFASNLDQYGTGSTAETRPHYSREQFEAIVGRTVIDSEISYRAMQASSLLSSLKALGLDHHLDEAERHSIESAITAGNVPGFD